MMAAPVVALHGIRVVRGARTVLDVPELAVERGPEQQRCRVRAISVWIAWT